jgi:DNA repair protein RecN (Recombination protein N)
LITKDGEDEVRSALSYINDDDRVQEIGRMIGGAKLTDSTLAHAREMLEGI